MSFSMACSPHHQQLTDNHHPLCLNNTPLTTATAIAAVPATSAAAIAAPNANATTARDDARRNNLGETKQERPYKVRDAPPLPPFLRTDDDNNP